MSSPTAVIAAVAPSMSRGSGRGARASPPTSDATATLPRVAAATGAGAAAEGGAPSRTVGPTAEGPDASGVVDGPDASRRAASSADRGSGRGRQNAWLHT